jgi:hypothetical protein
VFALETVVPVALSPFIFGETEHSAGPSLLRGIALVGILAAAVGLSRTDAVVEALTET